MKVLFKFHRLSKCVMKEFHVSHYSSVTGEDKIGESNALPCHANTEEPDSLVSE